MEDIKTYFSQHMGASSTNRSIVMSPAEVSSSTDIVDKTVRPDHIDTDNVRLAEG